LFLLLELLAFGFLFRLLRSKSPAEKIKCLTGLAVMTALEYYNMPQGKVLAAVVVSTLAFFFYYLKKMEKKYFYLFVLALAAMIWPMFRAELAPGGTDYLLSQAAHAINFNYFIALFWNGAGSQPYGPGWGGCFNSVLSSLVLIGLLEIIKKQRYSLAFWLGGSFVLFLLPGLLSGGLEMYRVLGTLPILILMAAFGLYGLVMNLSKNLRWPVIMIFLLFSGAMDFYHYVGPYQNEPETHRIWRNRNYQTAYRLLKSENDSGVKLGLLDFVTHDYDDHTLDVCVSPFDVFSNPRLNPQTAQKVAVMTDPNYEPFLKKRFPRGKWTWISEETSGATQGILLGVIPFDGRTEKDLKAFLEAGKVLREVKAMRMYWQFNQPLTEMLNLLFSRHQLFQKDPFLESVFGDETALFFSIQKDLPRAWLCYQNALKSGYPAANLYDEAGVLLAVKGSYAAARADFEKALKAPVNRTDALENLRKLGELERFKSKPGR
jgi:hypothetical protein